MVAAAPRLIGRGDDVYPSPLDDLPQPPSQLWWIGDWAVASPPPLVAIVGTRRSTAYGERATRELAGALARAGACIVSGMARGIDGVAHRAALDADGRTIAVLGTGADVIFPKAHRTLYEDIVARGLVLSELPPGAHAHGGSFPKRNRIIAALAGVTIVVEAPEGSGALLTSDRALELNRTVAAVPGPIDSPYSSGTNRLIREGAQVITSAADALALVGLTPPLRQPRTFESEAEARIWEALARGAATLDELCACSGLPVSECLGAVTTLELRGAIECALTGEVRRR